MPFTSKKQLRTCYGSTSKSKKWDCDKMLEDTPNVCDLPESSFSKQPKNLRVVKKEERTVSKTNTGPRGGKFFTITERDGKQKTCTLKVYVPKNKKRTSSKKKRVTKKKRRTSSKKRVSKKKRVTKKKRRTSSKKKSSK